MIAADTNLVAYLLIAGERTDAARRVWERDPRWALPPLWRSEFLNVLALALRAGVLSLEQALGTWSRASALFAGQEVEPAADRVLLAAHRLRISAYDAHFVVVAESLKVPLVTGDQRILRACPRTAISIEAFAAAVGDPGRVPR